MKRTDQKRITKEAIILRYMRQQKGISLNQAGAKVGITSSAIAHIEHGRIDLSRKRIETLVTAYGYSMDDYLDFTGPRSATHQHPGRMYRDHRAA